MIGLGGLGALLGVLGLVALVWKAKDLWSFFRGHTLQVVERAQKEHKARHSGVGMGWVIVLAFLVAVMGVAIVFLASM